MLLLKKISANTLRLGGVIGLFCICQATTAYASSLVFQGQNVGLFPNANPNSVTVLMNSVSKTKASESANRAAYAGISQATMIQNAVMSRVSTAIYNQIFDTSGPSSGFFDLGGGNTIAYQQNIAEQTVTITIVSSTTGTTTVIVPLGI